MKLGKGSLHMKLLNLFHKFNITWTRVLDPLYRYLNIMSLYPVMYISLSCSGLITSEKPQPLPWKLMLAYNMFSLTMARYFFRNDDRKLFWTAKSWPPLSMIKLSIYNKNNWINNMNAYIFYVVWFRNSILFNKFEMPEDVIVS